MKITEKVLESYGFNKQFLDEPTDNPDYYFTKHFNDVCLINDASDECEFYTIKLFDFNGIEITTVEDLDKTVKLFTKLMVNKK